MTSLLDRLFGQQQQQMNMNGPDLTDPSTVSSNVQQWLGAKPQVDTTGQVPSILAGRFSPSLEDAGNAALSSLNSGKYVSSQSVADNRASESLKNLEALTKAQFMAKGGGSGSVFAQTMEAINNDPSLASLSMMDKIRLAQNKLGTNLTMGADGKVADMNGAAQGLGNLAYGEKRGGQLGQDQVDLVYKPQIASGEAQARQEQELKYALPIETEKQTAQMNVAQQAALNKKATAANATVDLANEANSILDQASGSVPGALIASGKTFFGKSDAETQANARLGVIGGNLVSSMPRMEGPQSDKDVLLYQQMAGKIASPTIPAGDKRAALQTILNLNSKYSGQGVGPGTNLSMNPGLNLPGANALPQINQAQPKLAPDGHHYLPDPNRPGKYLRVD